MKNMLQQDDIIEIEKKIKSFEANTGSDLLIVCAKTSDEYPAAPLRFGVISGFLITFIFSLSFDFHHNYLWPLAMMLMIFIMTWVGHFSWAKRLALSDLEIHRESMEKALEYFHNLGTSKVSHKVTAMIMVSFFEKKIIVLVDEKLKSEITQAELDELITIMQKHFKTGEMAQGLIQSITSLEEKILKDFGGKVSDTDPSELENIIHFV